MEKIGEKLLERKLREAVKKRGGKALKFVSPGNNGVPDRLVLFPSGKMCFVEVKSTGIKPTPIQKLVHKEFRDLGYHVWVIDSTEGLALFLKYYAEQE